MKNLKKGEAEKLMTSLETKTDLVLNSFHKPIRERLMELMEMIRKVTKLKNENFYYLNSVRICIKKSPREYPRDIHNGFRYTTRIHFNSNNVFYFGENFFKIEFYNFGISIEKSVDIIENEVNKWINQTKERNKKNKSIEKKLS